MDKGGDEVGGGGAGVWVLDRGGEGAWVQVTEWARYDAIKPFFPPRSTQIQITSLCRRPINVYRAVCSMLGVKRCTVHSPR